MLLKPASGVACQMSIVENARVTTVSGSVPKATPCRSFSGLIISSGGMIAMSFDAPTVTAGDDSATAKFKKEMLKTYSVLSWTV